MRAVYWAIVIIIAAIVALFAASNREVVSLGFWPSPYNTAAPLYLVVIVALLVGLVIGIVATWLKGGARRRALRECRRQNASLANELAATQARLAGNGGSSRSVAEQPR